MAGDGVRRTSLAKERAVAAIVLYHKQADEKASRGDCEQEIKSISES
jgi:hypothetical protein